MRKEDLYFDSRDGSSRIHAVRWIPDETPKAVLQIIHGMAEYIERYESFAAYMCENGFLVVGDDQLGHGKTIEINKGTPGYMCAKHSETVIVRDEHRLKKTIQSEYPDIPYFVLGHSMGSFICRNYLCNYGTGINGAVVMGTGMNPKGVIAVSKALAGLQGVIFGDKHPAKLINKLAFGTYNSRIEGKETEYAWLSRDIAVQEKYISDPLCGFLFTVNGFKTLFNLIWNLHKEENLRRMPTDLPVFFVAGDCDPVGNYGSAVTQVYESFLSLGMKDVSMKLYPGDRHEILNELDKETVYGDIREWLENRIQGD